MENSKENYRRNKDIKQTRVTHLEKEFAVLDAEVEKLRQRDRFQETLDLCQVKHIHLLVNEAQTAFDATEQVKVVAENRLSDEKQKLGPLEARERDLKRQQ
eukprot:gene26752-33378_t